MNVVGLRAAGVSGCLVGILIGHFLIWPSWN